MKAVYGFILDYNPEMINFFLDKDAIVVLIASCEAKIEQAVKGRRYNEIKELLDVRSELAKALNEQHEFIERNES